MITKTVVVTNVISMPCGQLIRTVTGAPGFDDAENRECVAEWASLPVDEIAFDETRDVFIYRGTPIACLRREIRPITYIERRSDVWHHVTSLLKSALG